MSIHLHFRLHITREGKDYNVGKDSMESTLRWFLRPGHGQKCTIGGGDKDYVQVHGLTPCHLAVELTQSHLLFEAGEACELIARSFGQEKTGKIEPISLKKGGRHQIDLPTSKPAIEWKILFPNGAVVRGRVYPEKERLGHSAAKFLQSRYGDMEKIQESAASLIFLTRKKQVLKALRPSYVQGHLKVALRFINAARKFQTFRSPLFPRITEIGYHREHGLCYVATRYFHGIPLQDTLARKGIISLDRAKSIVKSVAERLVVLQQYHTCLRNLTPENIMIDNNGDIAITGFFLAKSDVQLTGEFTQMVRPGYTAPEQVKDASGVDIFADIYSLGAIFYCMLAGQPPLQAGNSMEYVDKLFKSPPLESGDILHTLPDLPQDIAKLIASMLAADKKYRPNPLKVVSLLGGDPKFENSLVTLEAPVRSNKIEVVTGDPPHKKSDAKISALNAKELEKIESDLEDGDKEITHENFTFVKELYIVNTGVAQKEEAVATKESDEEATKNALATFAIVVLSMLVVGAIICYQLYSFFSEKSAAKDEDKTAYEQHNSEPSPAEQEPENPAPLPQQTTTEVKNTPEEKDFRMLLALPENGFRRCLRKIEACEDFHRKYSKSAHRNTATQIANSLRAKIRLNTEIKLHALANKLKNTDELEWDELNDFPEELTSLKDAKGISYQERISALKSMQTQLVRKALEDDLAKLRKSLSKKHKPTQLHYRKWQKQSQAFAQIVQNEPTLLKLLKKCKETFRELEKPVVPKVDLQKFSGFLLRYRKNLKSRKYSTIKRDIEKFGDSVVGADAIRLLAALRQEQECLEFFYQRTSRGVKNCRGKHIVLKTMDGKKLEGTLERFRREILYIGKKKGLASYPLRKLSTQDLAMLAGQDIWDEKLDFAIGILYLADEAPAKAAKYFSRLHDFKPLCPQLYSGKGNQR